MNITHVVAPADGLGEDIKFIIMADEQGIYVSPEGFSGGEGSNLAPIVVEVIEGAPHVRVYGDCEADPVSVSLDLRMRAYSDDTPEG